MHRLSIRLIVPGRDFRFVAKHPLDMAEVLARHGHDVEVVCPMPDDVMTVNNQRGFQIKQIRAFPWLSAGSRRNISAMSLAFLKSLSPVDVTIGVDPMGYVVAHRLKRLRRSGRLVYYAMEMVLPEDRPNQSSVRYQSAHIGDADLVIATGPERAAMMQERLGLATMPMVLANTFVRPESVQPRLRQVIRERGYEPTETVVIFLGKLFEQHALREVIMSMPQWPTTAGFAFAGYGDPEYVAGLLTLTEELGLSDRVFHLGTIPSGASNVFALLKGADLGLVFKKYQGHIWNDVYYTPTKLLEYGAMGLPAICSDQDSLKFVEAEGWGVCVDVEEPAQIGQAVAEMLSERDRLTRASGTAKRLFDTVYCMEEQLVPFLQFLEEQETARQ